jgi:hypothetical protein
VTDPALTGVLAAIALTTGLGGFATLGRVTVRRLAQNETCR